MIVPAETPMDDATFPVDGERLVVPFLFRWLSTSTDDVDCHSLSNGMIV